MKILLLTDNFPPVKGGISSFIVNISRQLSLKQNKVDVLSAGDRFNSRTSLRAYSYNIINCKMTAHFSSIPVILKTLKLAKNNYDLVFMGNLQTTSAIGMYLISRLFRVPLVVLLHGLDLDYLNSKFFFDRFFARLYLKNTALILVNSKETCKKAQNIGVSLSKIKVLNPGVDTFFFTKRCGLESYKDKHGLNGKRVISTISRLVKRKGHSYVIEAVAKLKKEIPNMHYLIIGDGPEQEKLFRIAAKLEVSDMVSIIGHIEDQELPNYYSISEIFVMPTISEGNNYEGFGMVYLEANACGLPVIGSRSGGVLEAIVDGETGILVEESDVEGLTSAIKQLLQNELLRKSMGDKGRKRAEKDFSWDSVGNKLETYLKKCLVEN